MLLIGGYGYGRICLMAATGMLCGKVPLGAMSDIHTCMYKNMYKLLFSSFFCVYFPQKNMFTHVFRPVLCGIQPSFHTYFCMYICKYVLLWFFDGAHHKDIPIIAEWSSSSSLFLPIFHSFLHGLSAIWALSISISEASRLHNAFWYIFPFYSFFSIYFLGKDIERPERQFNVQNIFCSWSSSW